MIRYAYDQGARDIILGLGGSATNDGGMGALQALGVRIYLDSGECLSPIPTESLLARAADDAGIAESPLLACGKLLSKIVRVELPDDTTEGRESETAGGAESERPSGEETGRSWGRSLLPGASITLACDVTNPFVGAKGAVAVFSGQKGATASDQQELEAGMKNLVRVLQGATGTDISSVAGTGAAGGLAGGLHAAFRAPIVSGMALVQQYLQLREHVASADLVLTGEGAFDDSTADGKVVSQICSLCSELGKPLVIVCGISTAASSQHPIYSLVSMFDQATAMQSASQCLESLAQKHAEEWFARVSP